MNVLVEAVVAILQVGSIITLLYGLSLTLENGLNNALTVVAKKLRKSITRTKIDGVPSAA